MHCVWPLYLVFKSLHVRRGVIFSMGTWGRAERYIFYIPHAFLVSHHSLLFDTISEEAFVNVSSASLSIRSHNSLHDGISWIKPMT